MRMTDEQKEYKEYLNRTYPYDSTHNIGKGKNGRYKPNSRPYGDYLWAQDREMFLAGFEEWLKKGKKG